MSRTWPGVCRNLRMRSNITGPPSLVSCWTVSSSTDASCSERLCARAILHHNTTYDEHALRPIVTSNPDHTPSAGEVGNEDTQTHSQPGRFCLRRERRLTRTTSHGLC